jgi:hypothetical protein
VFGRRRSLLRSDWAHAVVVVAAADYVTRGQDEADHGRTGSAAPVLYTLGVAVARLLKTRTARPLMWPENSLERGCRVRLPPDIIIIIIVLTRVRVYAAR